MSVPASNSKTILITGINGYIAGVLGDLVLSKGYTLRGTVREKASAELLLTGPYKAYIERVEIFEVPDITVDGAFDEAVRGVHAIFHTASPVDFSLNTFENVIIPAMKGSEVVLASALKAGSQLKSVVVTSSVAAVIDPPSTPDYVYTEADFALTHLERAIKDRDEGVQSPGNVLYAASKAAAERKVWEFRNEHKPSFALSIINPTVVIGPPAVLASSGSRLNATLRPIFNILSGSVSALPPNIGSGSYVDVRDVAVIHLWAMENPSQADGERYIACAGFGPNQAAADVLYQKYRGSKVAEKIVRGTPGKGYVGYNKESETVGKVEYLPGSVQVNGKKGERVAGLRYISFQKSLLDTAEVLENLL